MQIREPSVGHAHLYSVANSTLLTYNSTEAEIVQAHTVRGIVEYFNKAFSPTKALTFLGTED